MNDGEWIKIGVGRVIHVSKIVCLSWVNDKIKIDTDDGDYRYVEHGYEGPFLAILGPKPD